MRKLQPVFLVMVIALWLPAWMLLGSLVGCETGYTGPLRPLDPAVEHTITNTISQAGAVASQVAPQPWNTFFEAGAAAVLALLGAWQGLTHSKVKQLETDNPQPKKFPPA